MAHHEMIPALKVPHEMITAPLAPQSDPTSESILFDVAYTNIDPEWRDFLESNGFLNEIKTILARIEKRYCGNAGSAASSSSALNIQSIICPEAKNILAFARFPFSRAKVLIMGQDPYPKRSQAHGLAFSVPHGVNIPGSLRNIYAALLSQKLIPEQPRTGNLSMWCEQGIILLNTALTTIESNTGAHLEDWQSFTHRLATKIGQANPGLIYMLFGSFAQKIKPAIPKTCAILEWGHPAPTNRSNGVTSDPKHFINCPAFRVANNMLIAVGKSPINWDPHVTQQQIETTMFSQTSALPMNAAAGSSQVPGQLRGHLEEISLGIDDQLACRSEDCLYAFVDGAASSNGQLNAIAGYAAIILNCTTMYQVVGNVPPAKEVHTARGYEGGAPTNNRAELMAMHDLFSVVSSESFISDNGGLKLIIVYDSAYAAGCLREWYETWRVKEKPEAIKKNMDIIPVAYELMKRVEGARKIEWIKISSHEKEPDDPESMEWYHWLGNKKVDELARGAVISGRPVSSSSTAASQP